MDGNAMIPSSPSARTKSKPTTTTTTTTTRKEDCRSQTSKCRNIIRAVSICAFALLLNIGGCFGAAAAFVGIVPIDNRMVSSNDDVILNNIHCNGNGNFLGNVSPTSLARQKSFERLSSTSLWAVGSSDLRGDKKKKKKNEHDDAKNNKKKKKKNRSDDDDSKEEVKRGGIRQLWARFRGTGNPPASEGIDTGNDDKDVKQETKKSRWRIFSRTSSPEQQQRQKQDPKKKKQKDKILGPLNSEILLAAELKKEEQQRQQENSILSSAKTTPLSPSVLPSFVDLEQNLKSARDTIAGVRTTDPISPTASSSTKSAEQQRIEQLRQDMERRRKEQELKKLEQKAKTLEEREKAAKKRDLLAKQRAKEEELRIKKIKGIERTKALKKVAQGGQIITNEGDDGTKDEKQGDGKSGSGLGAFIKSRFSNITSTDTATSSEKKDQAEGDKGWGVGEYVTGVISGVATAAQRTFRSGKNSNPNEEWIVVCPKIAVAPGVQVPVVAGGIDLLLVVSKDGKTISCVANTCPHLGTPLETGIIERRPREDEEGNVETPKKGASKTLDAKNSDKSDLSTTLEKVDDGCEDCIVCPLHQTAFALESGEVRGEWCPYPPVIGNVMGMVKAKSRLPTFKVRTRGKNVEVLINSSLEVEEGEDGEDDSKRKR